MSNPRFAGVHKAADGKQCGVNQWIPYSPIYSFNSSNGVSVPVIPQLVQPPVAYDGNINIDWSGIDKAGAVGSVGLKPTVAIDFRHSGAFTDAEMKLPQLGTAVTWKIQIVVFSGLFLVMLLCALMVRLMQISANSNDTKGSDKAI
jgi:hypothetical protein